MTLHLIQVCIRQHPQILSPLFTIVHANQFQAVGISTDFLLLPDLKYRQYASL